MLHSFVRYNLPMNSYRRHFLFGLLVIFLYFLPLFFPTPKFILTSEFLRSDNWHQNYPFKVFLSQSLKSGQLPAWNKYVSGGFPVLAEGQIGTFHLPNLILFGLLPPWLAWNLGYIVIFLLHFTGMFAFLKSHKHPPLTTLFGSLIYTFAGYFVVKLVHFNHLQAMSLLPWIFWATHRLTKKPTITSVLILGFLFSQQLFAGHFQYSLITVLGVGLYLFFQPSVRHNFTLLFFSGLVSLSLSAAQILPTLDFTRSSTRASGLTPDAIFQFPLKLTDLIALINPRLLGNPAANSYPFPQSLHQGIYWENITYLGTIPFFLIVLAITQPQIRRSHMGKFALVASTFSLVLALGQLTPFSLLHTLPPLNLFRLPSRFLLLSTFSLAWLATLGFDRLTRIKPNLAHLLIAVSLVDLLSFNLNLHPTTPVSDVLTPPSITKHLSTDSHIFIHTSAFLSWQNTFISTGWQSATPYLYYKNSLLPNQNLLYNYTSLENYAAFFPQRLSPYQALHTQNSILAAGTEYLIATTPLNSSETTLLTTIQPTFNLPPHFLYAYNHPISRFRFVSDYVSTNSYSESLVYLKEHPNFDFTNSAVIEIPMSTQLKPSSEQTIKLLKDTHQQLSLQTSTDSQSLLVITDTYDPNWHATINNQPTPIIPANLNQRALVIPTGQNTITMTYQPQSLRLGLWISALSHLSILGIFFYFNRRFFQSFPLSFKR